MSNRKLGWGLYIFIVIILIASVAVLVSAWGVGKSLVIFGAVGIVTLINWRAKKKKAQEQAREEEPKKLEEEQARSKIVLVEAVTDLADKAPIALGERADAGPPVDRNRFDDGEWETLLYTPQWVFIAVGVVDKTVGSHEQIQAMIRELGAPEHYDSPLFGQVLKAWCADMNSILERWKADSRKIPEGLRDTRRLLDAKLAPDSAKAFKECLFNLGRAIAEAGGEGAPGGGVLQMPKVSFDEQDVLIDISIMLGLREGVRPLSPWVNSMIAALDERAVPPPDKVPAVPEPAAPPPPPSPRTEVQTSAQLPRPEAKPAEVISSKPKEISVSEDSLPPIPAVPATSAAPLQWKTILLSVGALLLVIVLDSVRIGTVISHYYAIGIGAILGQVCVFAVAGSRIERKKWLHLFVAAILAAAIVAFASVIFPRATRYFAPLRFLLHLNWFVSVFLHMFLFMGVGGALSYGFVKLKSARAGVAGSGSGAASPSVAGRKGNTKVLIICGSLAAVVLLGIVGYFVFRPKPYTRKFSSYTTSSTVKPKPSPDARARTASVGSVPAKHYHCVMFIVDHLVDTAPFTITGDSTYTDSKGVRGTFTFESGSSTLAFHGGNLSGQRAQYDTKTKHLHILGPSGRRVIECD